MEELQKELQEMTPVQRIRRLEAIAEKAERKKAAIPLPEERMANLDHEIAERAIEVHDKKEEKSAYVKEINAMIKEMEQALRGLMESHRSGQEILETTVYTVQNDATGMVEEYAENGQLINSRRMKRLEQFSNRKAIGDSE